VNKWIVVLADPKQQPQPEVLEIVFYGTEAPPVARAIVAAMRAHGWSARLEIVRRERVE
jgi:hypothetical protein